MAICVRCGKEAPDPVWAAYADPAFQDKPPAPLALHQDCYDESETIEAVRWEDVDTTPVLVTETARRYLPLEEAVAAWTQRELSKAGG
jgi:hypothetical protein